MRSKILLLWILAFLASAVVHGCFIFIPGSARARTPLERKKTEDARKKEITFLLPLPAKRKVKAGSKGTPKASSQGIPPLAGIPISKNGDLRVDPYPNFRIPQTTRIRISLRDPKTALLASASLGVPFVYYVPGKIWRVELSPIWGDLKEVVPLPLQGEIQLHAVQTGSAEGEGGFFSTLAREVGKRVGALNGLLGWVFDDRTRRALTPSLKAFCLRRGIDPREVRDLSISFVLQRGRGEVRVISVRTRDGRIIESRP